MSTPLRRDLTTTSYAILGLLATRPWSTYELTKQMGRSLRHVWPRAESNVYAEAKRLEAAGLAAAEVQRHGRRDRTLYTITPQGERALRDWLGTASAPSRFESETLVKVLFGNLGTKEELLANLRRFLEEAEAAREFWKAVADEYARGIFPYPDRVHINALFFRWNWEQVETNARWAAWAIEQVESWPDTVTGADLDASLETFREVLRSVYATL
jgi:DNA-binding PadR family transcriptional regulator